ncbi:calcium-binding protein KIC [Cryptomeria japonica]|uniref:calcium-binding protein KIC n=1 Tax=Cryptomeria japonica TaxID=3369 RepID=UPI0027DA0BD9|nr:calcium-binding protein KIC [Cryptomeria japonica]
MAEFQDFLPIMAEKLGGAGLMAELCKGFRSLADPQRGLITVDSLRKNSAVLGVESLTDSEIQAMVQQGDLDGDGALNEHEFCVLMVRLSPSFMAEADKWLQKALTEEMEEALKYLCIH